MKRIVPDEYHLLISKQLDQVVVGD